MCAMTNYTFYNENSSSLVDWLHSIGREHHCVSNAISGMGTIITPQNSMYPHLRIRRITTTAKQLALTNIRGVRKDATGVQKETRL